MATLPQGSDLRKGPLGNITPDVKQGALDYSPLSGRGGGIAALGSGMGTAAKALGDFGAKLESDQNEVDDFETKKRLMDFKLKTEMELENDKRDMPLGGNGYAQTWNQKYQALAQDFVGDKDSLIPKSQRIKVGLALRAQETMLNERAVRDEFAERDRHTIAGLEDTVTAYKSRVMADPTQHDAVQKDIGSLIELAPITPAQRDVYRKRVKAQIQEEAGQSWADRATNAQGLEDARKILAPHLADKADAAAAGAIPATYAEQIKKSEGFTARASWDYKQHSIGYGTKARAPGEVIDKPEAERRFNEEIANAAKIVDGFKPGLDQGTRAALISLTFNAGDAWTKQGLGQAVQAGDLAAAKQQFLQYNKAGGQTLPGLASRRQQEADWIGRDGPTPKGEASYMDAGLETYAGPFGDLPLAKRRALWNRAQATYSKSVDEVQGAVRDQMKASEKGVLPPDAWLSAIEPKLKALNDPLTNALYATMLGKAEMTARFGGLPPQVQTLLAQSERANLDGKATAEQLTALEHREKLAAQATKDAADDPISWAARNKAVIPLTNGIPPADLDPVKQGDWTAQHRKASEMVRDGRADEAMQTYPGFFKRATFSALNFNAPDIDKQLDDRMETAKGVGAFNGGPVQSFTKSDREMLGNMLAGGGKPMLVVMSKIANAAARNGIDVSQAMSEFSSRDAPEVAMVGHLFGAGADERTLYVASKAIAWKQSLGEKFISTIDKAQAKPSLGNYASVLSSSPTSVDHVRKLANLIYEYESRGPAGQGKTEFSQSLYDGIVHRIMGETEQGGVKFGGVGAQGSEWGRWSNWTDGKSARQVLVPAGVRQDSFDTLLAGVRADDVVNMGGQQPLSPKFTKPDGTIRGGTPYSMSEMRQMDWVNWSPPGAPPIAGIYMLKVGSLPSGAPIYAENAKGKPAVLDMRPVLPEIQKRKPEIFAGYDSSQTAVTAPDPQYPSTMANPLPTAAAQASGIQPRSPMRGKLPAPQGLLRGINRDGSDPQATWDANEKIRLQQEQANLQAPND